MNSPINIVNTNSKLSKHCIHTKHIYLLIDMPANEESAKRLKKHMENCEICKNEYHRFTLKSESLKSIIPKVVMDRDLKQSFEREVFELFKIMEMTPASHLKRKVKKGFLFVDKMGIDFFKNLISKTMLKTYVFSLLILVLLKIIL